MFYRVVWHHICEAPPRTFDVASFIGDPQRTSELLGWRARSGLPSMLPGLIASLTDAGTQVVT